MARIGQAVLDHKIKRIKSATNSKDQHAKELLPRYAANKVKKGLSDRRDWQFRRVTLRSLKVKVASQEKVTIGATNGAVDTILTVQRRKEEMWSDSPSDTAVLKQATLDELRAHPPIQVQKTA